jgi:FkbM family methyltransferase
VSGRLRWAIKRLRASQPANAVLTGTVRTGLRLTGARSEFAAMHLPRVGTTRSRLPNGRVLTLHSAGDDWVSNRVFWFGWSGYEPEASAFFFDLARRSRCTVDVGAHVGFYALLAAHANPAGRVIAFEPLDLAFDRLTRNVALNRLDNLRTERLAVAEQAERRSFRVAHGDGIPSNSGFRGGGAGARIVDVETVRLDDYLDEHRIDAVDLVKIDTEATEPEVLAGMPRTLQRDRPDILCEVLPWADTDRLERLLEPHGYRYYQLLADGPTRRQRISGEPVWFNYLFTARPSV